MKKLTKLDMLNEMFQGTQFEKHIKEDIKLPKETIERVYNVFNNYKNNTQYHNIRFCSALLTH